MKARIVRKVECRRFERGNVAPSGIEALRGQRVFDLYRTPSGSYFKYETTASLFVEDEEPEIIPMSKEEAQSLCEEIDDRQLAFEDAFPAVCLTR